MWYNSRIPIRGGRVENPLRLLEKSEVCSFCIASAVATRKAIFYMVVFYAPADW